ncbi:hypothetical protein HAX54_003059, partial [Datura stramonium]|nr:hypothetical protein [Datura stramonium]
MANPYMTFLDEAMASPHTAKGPIDDLLTRLGEDNDVEHGDDGGKDATANYD